MVSTRSCYRFHSLKTTREKTCIRMPPFSWILAFWKRGWSFCRAKTKKSTTWRHEWRVVWQPNALFCSCLRARASESRSLDRRVRVFTVRANSITILVFIQKYSFPLSTLSLSPSLVSHTHRRFLLLSLLSLLHFDLRRGFLHTVSALFFSDGEGADVTSLHVSVFIFDFP